MGLDNYLGILALIILLIVLVLFIRYKANHEEDEQEDEEVVVKKVVNNASPLNLNDEDATVAALIASIEYRNETKKDVRVISVKEI